MSERTLNSIPEAPLVAVLGGGVMGGTLVTALRVGGWGPDRVVVAEKDAARAEALRQGYGIKVTSDIDFDHNCITSFGGWPGPLIRVFLKLNKISFLSKLVNVNH